MTDFLVVPTLSTLPFHVLPALSTLIGGEEVFLMFRT